MKRILLSLLVFSVVFVALRVIDVMRQGRSERRDDVVRTITQSAGGAIELMTPVLEVDVVEDYQLREARTREVVKQGLVVKEEYTELVARKDTRRLIMLPAEVDLKATSQVETRFIGIFPGRVQHARVHLTGTFVLPAKLLAPAFGGTTTLNHGALSVRLRSLRSLEQFTDARWQAQPVRFEPSPTEMPGFESAAAELPVASLVTDTPIPFDLSLALRGGSSFTVHPVAERSNLQLDADWPHADFTLHGGTSFLPSERTVSATGTHAVWLTTGLSSGLKRFYKATEEQPLFEHVLAASVGADFVEPVDVFLRLERSVKYGVPLIALSLSLLWLVVARSKAKTHVVHYTLVALNLAVFFLLLLSFAEKVDFLVAYAISAVAVTTLNVIYLSSILKGVAKAVSATLPSAASFVALYALLVSEDSALLFGSLFVFAVLAGLMFFTRHLDWNEVLRTKRPDEA